MTTIAARGLDYAYQHPDVACAARAGYTFVARYIGDPDPNGAKYLDAAELARIRAAGLAVVAARETSAGFMLTESGADHARRSREHCNQLGMAGVPIFYALDVDPRGLSAAQVDAVGRFLQDAAAADGGGHNVGLYAAHEGIERWVGTPYCQWGWQTYAWSAGKVSAKAHLRQHDNGRQLCGGVVDLNEAYRPDFGQWPRYEADGPTPTPSEEDDVFTIQVSGQPVRLVIGGVAIGFDDIATRDRVLTAFRRAGVLTTKPVVFDRAADHDMVLRKLVTQGDLDAILRAASTTQLGEAMVDIDAIRKNLGTGTGNVLRAPLVDVVREALRQAGAEA